MKRFWIYVVFWIAFFAIYTSIVCLFPLAEEVLLRMALWYTVFSLTVKFADWIFKKE